MRTVNGNNNVISLALASSRWCGNRLLGPISLLRKPTDWRTRLSPRRERSGGQVDFGPLIGCVDRSVACFTGVSYRAVFCAEWFRGILGGSGRRPLDWIMSGAATMACWTSVD